MLVGGSHVVADDLEIEDGIFDRDRDVVLGLILDGAFELGPLHERQVNESHDDLLVRDADADVFALDSRLSPQIANGRGDRLAVDDLAVDDSAHRHGDARITGQGNART